MLFHAYLGSDQQRRKLGVSALLKRRGSPSTATRLSSSNMVRFLSDSQLKQRQATFGLFRPIRLRASVAGGVLTCCGRLGGGLMSSAQASLHAAASTAARRSAWLAAGGVQQTRRTQSQLFGGACWKARDWFMCYGIGRNGTCWRRLGVQSSTNYFSGPQHLPGRSGISSADTAQVPLAGVGLRATECWLTSG